MKFIVVLRFVTLKVTQYPFEKYPVKKYDSVAFKTVDVNDSTQMVIQYKNYTIKLLEVKN